MRIADVRAHRWDRAVLVEALSDTGVSGWGEVGASLAEAAEEWIRLKVKPAALGRQAWDIGPLCEALAHQNCDPAVISGLDCAMWDLRAKLTGLPVYKLLGGSYRERIRAFAVVGAAAGQITPQQAAERAAQFARSGYTAVKLAMQFGEDRINPHPDPTLAYAKAIRQAIGDGVDFWVDLDRGCTAARAVELGRRLREETAARFLEEPVSTRNLHELAQVADVLEMPVISGARESSLWRMRDLMDDGHADILTVDLTRCGGITVAKKIAALAQSLSKPIMARGGATAVGQAAALHFAASISNASPFIEARPGVAMESGYLKVPQLPGLGAGGREQRESASK